MSLSRRTLAKLSGAALLPLVAPAISRAADTQTLRFMPSEYVSGTKTVYEWFDGYQPWQEAPEQQDPYGFVALARFNSLQPPFNNPWPRQAVLSAVNQDEYMQAIVGTDPGSHRACHALLLCGMGGVRETGAGVPNLERRAPR